MSAQEQRFYASTILGHAGVNRDAGPETARFGGNPSCVEVVAKGGGRFILDCGTGVRQLGLHLAAKRQPRIRAIILLSYTHWDHIQGFRSFARYSRRATNS